MKPPYQVRQGQEIGQALTFNDFDMRRINGQLSKGRIHAYPMAIYPALRPGMVKKSPVSLGINQTIDNTGRDFHGTGKGCIKICMSLALGFPFRKHVQRRKDVNRLLFDVVLNPLYQQTDLFQRRLSLLSNIFWGF